MSTNDFTTVDYQEEARTRYTDRFNLEHHPVYDAYLSFLTKALNDLQDVFKDLMQLRSLDTAEGVQLDVIGSLVGQPRELINYELYPFFGFEKSLNGRGFGTLVNPNDGGVFSSLQDGEGVSALLDDDSYRFLIKARIVSNTSKGTTESLLKGMNFLLGGNYVTITEPGNAHLKIHFNRVLTDLEEYFMRSLADTGSIIPIPIGVSLELKFYEGYGIRYGAQYGN